MPLIQMALLIIFFIDFTNQMDGMKNSNLRSKKKKKIFFFGENYKINLKIIKRKYDVLNLGPISVWSQVRSANQSLVSL